MQKWKMPKQHTEKEWMHRGLRLLAVGSTLGVRCGYVEVPEGHSLFGLDRGDKRVQRLKVHGGVNFSGIKHGSYVLGFDCGHWMDRVDPSLLPEDMDEETKRLILRGWEFGKLRTLKYVIKETERLADQIIEIKT